jgi:hypothetical protein
LQIPLKGAYFSNKRSELFKDSTTEQSEDEEIQLTLPVKKKKLKIPPLTEE